MKRNLKIFLCLALSICMMLGMLPLVAVAAAPVAYGTAIDGDLLYTVNFNGDATFDPSYSKLATEGIAKISDGESTGSILTFSEKAEAVSDFYGGFLKDYRIKGNVYTITFYVENANPSTIQAGVQLFSNSTTGDPHDGRMGFGLTKDANYHMTVINSDTPRGDTSSFMHGFAKQTVYVDANNRSYYTVVVDGISNVALFYAIQKSDTNVYRYVGKMNINPLTDFDYLAIGLHTANIIDSGKSIALGNVKIFKGNHVTVGAENFTVAMSSVNMYTADMNIGSGLSSAYRTFYDSKNYGETLIPVNFAASDDFKWISASYAPKNAEVIDEGKAVTLTGTSAGVRAYMPYEKEMPLYGDYTYEFYVNSETRTGLLVLGFTWGTGWYGLGFNYFDGEKQFLSHLNASSTAENINTYCNFVATSFDTSTNPDITDSSKPNVKIEFDANNRTVSNYVLSNAENNTWVKVSMLDYSSASSNCLPVVFLINQGVASTATYKNFNIVKGLTASDPTGANREKFVSVTVDGKYGTGYLPANESLFAKLAVKLAKPSYTLSFEDGEGHAVTSVSDLKLKALDNTPSSAYNVVDLHPVYKPVVTLEGLEVRGIQHSTVPDTVKNLTSVRFIGALDGLNYSQAGFLITAKWKDAEGVVHTGTNTVNKGTETVYTSIAVAQNSGYEVVTAAEMGVEYLVAIVVENVPIGEGVQVDFTVTPYTVPSGQAPAQDRSNYTLYAVHTYSFVNGVYSDSAAPLA